MASEAFMSQDEYYARARANLRDLFEVYEPRATISPAANIAAEVNAWASVITTIFTKYGRQMSDRDFRDLEDTLAEMHGTSLALRT